MPPSDRTEAALRFSFEKSRPYQKSSQKNDLLQQTSANQNPQQNASFRRRCRSQEFCNSGQNEISIPVPLMQRLNPNHLWDSQPADEPESAREFLTGWVLRHRKYEGASRRIVPSEQSAIRNHSALLLRKPFGHFPNGRVLTSHRDQLACCRGRSG